jgi:hypothetical protein
VQAAPKSNSSKIIMNVDNYNLRASRTFKIQVNDERACDESYQQYSIDDFVSNYDIEETELNMLIGASARIKRFKPKIAICTFNKH